MPPHTHQRPPSLFLFTPRRLACGLLCAGALLLAGCASQPDAQRSAQAGDTHVLRDSYLLSTRSDPLGAWLRNSNQLALDGAQSQADEQSPAPRTMARTALEFLGVKYRYGGSGPQQGFDCSGLVAYAAEKSLGLKLPHSAREQARLGESVSRSELRRGDLVFFNTLGKRYSHVGIYLGDQKFVHAPRTGAAIRVESMTVAYWSKRFTGARRLQPEATTTAHAAVKGR